MISTNKYYTILCTSCLKALDLKRVDNLYIAYQQLIASKWYVSKVEGQATKCYCEECHEIKQVGIRESDIRVSMTMIDSEKKEHIVNVRDFLDWAIESIDLFKMTHDEKITLDRILLIIRKNVEVGSRHYDFKLVDRLIYLINRRIEQEPGLVLNRAVLDKILGAPPPRLSIISNLRNN